MKCHSKRFESSGCAAKSGDGWAWSSDASFTVRWILVCCFRQCSRQQAWRYIRIRLIVGFLDENCPMVDMVGGLAVVRLGLTALELMTFEVAGCGMRYSQVYNMVDVSR